MIFNFKIKKKLKIKLFYTLKFSIKKLLHPFYSIVDKIDEAGFAFGCGEIF